MTVVFHFTDTLRLPWILAEQQLNPTRGMAAPDYPRPTFLWATTNAIGDRTAASSHDQGRLLWRQGGSLLVRFTLAADDFIPWADIRKQYPQWTPEKIARVERNGRKKGSDPSWWMCRADILPAQRWLGIETRSYVGSWRPFDFTAYTARELQLDNPTTAARRVETFQQQPDEVCAAVIEIDGRSYVSRRIIPSNGRTLYMAAVSR
jgi:hypothetical protein